MAYLRRWRKVKAAVTAELESSSEDESIVHVAPVDNHEQNRSTYSPQPSSSNALSQTEYSSRHEGCIGTDDRDDSDNYSIIWDDSSDNGACIPGLTVPDSSNISGKLAEWATKHHQTRVSINELLGILRDEDIPVPKDARTLLQTPKEIPVENRCGGKYAYFSLEAGIIKTLQMSRSERIPTSIDLHVNIDGIPLFKSSGTQFWPIICSFDNYRPFVVALFYGEKKPNSVGEFLENFLTEYTKLQANGILFNDTVIKIQIKTFVCDAPARAFLKCTKGHTGYFACERCIIKGTWENNRVVLKGDFPSRTDEKFANSEYTDHQIGISPLAEANFPCVSGFCLDYMHLVCLGVVKRIVWFLKHGPAACKLSHRHIGEISSSLVSFSGKLPSEFARQPRPLTEHERWKATEFRQFLLYTGPIALKGILSKTAYQHFLCLTVAVFILLDTDNRKREAYLDYAGQLLNYFVDSSPDIYTNAFLVYNVHGLKHLANDVRIFQCSLNSISAFPFENHLQILILKRLVKSANNPIGQVGKRISEIEYAGTQLTSDNYSSLSYISSNKRNGCLLLKNEDFAFVLEKRDDGKLVCDVIHQRHTDNFFTAPCKSQLINIAFVRNFQRSQRKLVDPSEVLRKVVCLP